MKKSWLIDTLIGFALLLAFSAAYFVKYPLTEAMEMRLYDVRMRLVKSMPMTDQFVLVAIDEDSLARVGRWPWPRGLVAQLINQIASGQPAVLGVKILYDTNDSSQGLDKVRELREVFETKIREFNLKNGPTLKKIKSDPRFKKSPIDTTPLQTILDEFFAAEGQLDNDTQLSQVLAETERVVLPFFFQLDQTAQEAAEKLEHLKPLAIQKVLPAVNATERTGFDPILPLPVFTQGKLGLGHINLFPDADGVVRRTTPVMKYASSYYLSFPMEVLRMGLGVKPEEVQLIVGKELRIGPKTIHLTENNEYLVNFNTPFESISYVSAAQIIAEEVTPDVFKNKIVLLGTRATGLDPLFVVPTGANYPDAALVATFINNILKDSYISRPGWAEALEWGLLILAGLFTALLLPHVKAKWGALAALIVLGLNFGAGAYLFVEKGLWIKIFYSTGMLLIGYTAITIRQLFFTERRKELVEAESIETNKMLGLSFQGQGQLDLAFEKFRKCPVDEPLKEILYNLALDYERKRQFNKAVVVYERISSADPGYKDVKDRMKATKTAGETMMAGPGLGGGRKEGTVVIEGAAVKPTLGRYEIEKELGRGAMGVVYLGKDPKINRQVAIKTLRFDDDVDEATAKHVKERFFREAESAGTLNHPNIIRIFDAGDDNDISYIAMELLDGEDLKKYGEKAHLLPTQQVMEYVALTADALDYAHEKGVVHRDIKPANIMRLKDGTLRVTDFGIARITASSKTQTGTVMGTPSYMSPEQIAGRKVDGRADLFSLGVMFYEMMTGEKPFDGDSIATLLFRISSEPHPDPVLKAVERVTPGVRAIIDKALQKNPEQRYQRGSDMARDIRECMKNPNAVPAGAAVAAPPAAQTQPPAPAAPPAASNTQPPPPAPADRTMPVMPPAANAATQPVLQPPAVPPQVAAAIQSALAPAPPAEGKPIPTLPTDAADKTMPLMPPAAPGAGQAEQTQKLPPNAEGTLRMPPEPGKPDDTLRIS